MKTEKNNKLRGTVLFTVVAVMALLIIFLTGTLALATASSNRAHKSYSSSQASYTAKTAIAGFTEAMSRNADVAKTVMNLGRGSNDSVIHPEVRVKSGTNDDRSIGLIGYWDKNGVWQQNRITVEKVDSTGQYTYDTDKYSKTYGQWVAVDLVKITATARVGKEESTVTGYIKKRPSETKTQNNEGSGGIKGFNTIGDGSFANGGRFTGGLGVGLKKNVKQDYILHNGFEADTTLTFINGNVLAGTSTFALDCHNQAGRPAQETIINGNFWVSNGQSKPLVELAKDYYMTSEYTQQQIAYLYVDGLFGFSSMCTIVDREPGANADEQKVLDEKVAPFNVFCGTFVANRNIYTIKSADLYMMDPYVGENEAYTNVATEWQRQTVDGVNNVPAASKYENFVKGNNYFGSNNGSNNLYGWVDDVLNKTGEQNQSHGGSIYCNGNLFLGMVKQIDGDVRVEGDCYIGCDKKNGNLTAWGESVDMTIKGDLVVHGNLYLNGDPNKLKISARNIYCDPEKIHFVGGDGFYTSSGGGGSDETFKSVDNFYHEAKSSANVRKLEDEIVKRELFKWNPAEHTNSLGDMLLINGEVTEDPQALYYKWQDDYAPTVKLYKKDADLKLVYPGEEFDDSQYEDLGLAANKINEIAARINSDTDENADSNDEGGSFASVITEEDRAIINKIIKLDSVRTEEQLDKVENDSPKTWYYTIPEIMNSENADEPVFRSTSKETDKDAVYYDADKKVITTDPPVDTLPYYTIKDYDEVTDTEVVTEDLVTYYSNKTKQIVTKEYVDQVNASATSTGTLSNVNVYRYSAYGKSAYPDTMKREAIYAPKGTKTKIVKTADEVRAEMKIDDLNASYPADVPDEVVSAEDGTTYKQLCAANIAWNSSGKVTTCAAWKKNGETVTDTIVSSCTIKGALNKTITIAPKGNETIWVILDGVTFGDNNDIVVDLKSDKKEESGKVCFLIKGKLNLYNGNAIVNKKIIDNAPLAIDMSSNPHKNTDFGMEFYGATGSSIFMRNNCTMSGTFRCPRTDIACTTGGKYKVNYTDEYGHNWLGKGGGQERGGDPMQGKAPLIGNALFKDALTVTDMPYEGVKAFDMNNFGMYYTDSGMNGNSNGNNNGDAQTVETAEGIFDLIYFSGV